MKLSRFKSIFFVMLLAASLMFAVSYNPYGGGDAYATDTVFTSTQTHTVGASLTLDCTLDSTQDIVTNWFDMTGAKVQTKYLIYKLTAVYHAANFDTVMIIVQGMDALGSVINVDTAGTVTSTGTATAVTLTPTTELPNWRLYFKNVNTGGNVNGNPTLKLTIYTKPT